MKYLGIDYGAKRVGVAVSNAEGTIAFPRETILNNGQLSQALIEIILHEKPEAIVIGDTRTLEGAANPVTVEADAFAERLHEATHLPVKRAREAGSSIAASDGSDGHDDSSAAAFILQRYLDMHPKQVQS